MPCRYKVMRGGRGGGKSWTVARVLLLMGAQRPLRILCGREFQVSIKQSVHELLSQQIRAMGLQKFYEIQRTSILNPLGTEFFFAGLYHNIENIKSVESVDILWIEEAQSTTAHSWALIPPTIRKPGSEIWITFNPHDEEDVIYKEFVTNPHRDNCWSTKVNYCDNPWFPDVLEQERLDCLRINPDDYAWIWEGECRTRSDAQILNGKWRVESFEPGDDWDGPYHGADWGFANDPTTANRVWIRGRSLFVEYESNQVGLELDHTADRWRRDIPGIENYIVRADSARPESISHVRRKGIPRLTAADKWQGSVEDGVAYLRSFEEIVIHPRCPNTARECRLYSYKVDKRTGDILPSIVDAHNHHIDGIRYALAPLIKNKGAAYGVSRARW